MRAGLGRTERVHVGSDGSCAAPAAAIKQQVDPFIETKLRLSS